MNDLGFQTYLIDLYDLSFPNRTGSYIIVEDDVTIIETCASPSHKYLLSGLNELNIPLEKVKNVIVTHIHLDHSGGAGLLMEKCPNATLFVHPKGQSHLSDPTKLIASAKQVYGEDFNRLFNPILPIDSNRIKQVSDGENLAIGKNRLLTFIHTPGHANHHISIFDSVSNFMYTGDTLGIYYPQLKDDIGTFILPSTSPNQFSKDFTLQSLEKIKQFNPKAICFGHYGISYDINKIYYSLVTYLDLFVSEANRIYFENENLPFYDQCKLLNISLFEKIRSELRNLTIKDDHPIYQIIKLDIEVSSMGLIYSITKKR